MIVNEMITVCHTAFCIVIYFTVSPHYRNKKMANPGFSETFCPMCNLRQFFFKLQYPNVCNIKQRCHLYMYVLYVMRCVCKPEMPRKLYCMALFLEQSTWWNIEQVPYYVSTSSWVTPLYCIELNTKHAISSSGCDACCLLIFHSNFNGPAVSWPWPEHSQTSSGFFCTSLHSSSVFLLHGLAEGCRVIGESIWRRWWWFWSQLACR